MQWWRSRPRQIATKFRSYLRETPKNYHFLFTTSLVDWLKYHQREIVFSQCHWMGVPILKNPLDAWILQEIIWDTRPEVILEIGSFAGGSTLYLAHLLELLGQGTVVSIERDRSRYVARHKRIIELTGDSQSTDIISQVAARCNGKRTMVIHDGDHRKEAVLADLLVYSSFVSLGHYVIVEDGIGDLFPATDRMGLAEDGPLTAIEEFLRENPCFLVDTTRERYVLTCNPKGFLKKVSQ
jgi:cephalosporin hydroxylase